jgi:hypothetical protein
MTPDRTARGTRHGATPAWLLALSLTLAIVPGARHAVAADGRIRPTTPNLAGAGQFGRLLETLPAVETPAARRQRIARPEGMEHFRPGYVQCAVRATTATGAAARPPETATTTKTWLFAGQPDAATAFTFRCPIRNDATLRLWAFSGADATTPTPVPVRAGSRHFDLEIPTTGQQLLLYEIPLGDDPCGSASALTAAINGAELPPHLVMSPPMIVESLDTGATARAPVVLISLDTQRLDFWDRSVSRPPSLQAFERDALRYTQAYASFATTAQSHSVLFSGRFFSDVRRQPLDARLSFASSLQQSGYVTMGFVAGGYMRAGFGFGRRVPGFAIGFDLYVEGMQLDDKLKQQEASRHTSVLASEAALQTHTLGPALERSLRWLLRNPTEPIFHFIQGYDVHEYRSVAREYWDATVQRRVAAGLDRTSLEDCITTTGFQMDATLVAHHRFEDSEAFRTRALGAVEGCHRMIASLMYEARVHSVEMAIGRYLEALRTLGVYDRALIILTSDHGESLLDETGPGDARPYWGHNRVLLNNLAVPLWIKLPGARGNGAVVDDVAGLVDIPATIADVLDVDMPAGSGRSLVRSAGDGGGDRHARIVRFEDWRGEHGVVLPTGELCTWSHEKPHPLSIYAHASKAWRPPTAEERERCATARAGKRPAPPHQKGTQDIPPEVVEELRALGYVE